MYNNEKSIINFTLKVLSISLSLLIMLSATSFSHVTKAVAEDSKIVFTEKYLDEPETETRSVPIITPIDPGDGGGSLALDNDSNNVYIKSTSNIYLGKNSNGDLIGSTTAGYNRYKWQLIKNSDGTYYIVNADSKVENVWPYKFVLSCSSSGVISLEPYHGTDRDQKWNVNTTTVNNTVYYTIRSINGYYLNILSSGTVSATTATCLNSVVQCSNTNQMTDDTKEYIDKINNSGLITQMNCYAYALGVYHKYEPYLDKITLNNETAYYWRFPMLQMGDIAGNQNDVVSIFTNSSYYTTSLFGTRSLNAAGKTAIKNVILDAVEDDLYEMYDYTGGIVSTTNDAICFSDWRKVALVIDTEDVIVDSTGTKLGGYDYHWYVQHEDGTWTHKPGITAVTAYDNNGQLITDPANAARGSYNYFAGYYMIRCDYVLNDALNGMHVTTYNNDESGDILAHAYSSATHVSTSYDKLFTGKIEYGKCDIWKADFSSAGVAYTYVYYDCGTYWTKEKYIYNTGETEVVSEIEATSAEEVSDLERTQYYISQSSTTSHSDSPDLPCDVDFYEFTVAVSGTYSIYTDYYSSSEQLDTYGILYHDNSVLYTNDDGAGNYKYNFCITAYLTAGRTYRISVKAYNQANMGRYKLYISYQG